MINKKFLILGFSILILVGILISLRQYLERFYFKPQESIKEKITPAKEVEDYEIVVKNLEIPWSIVFLNENEFLITERPGKVKIFNLRER
ncbi:MAG: PQQ-dependent sugar dehydrogenase, partial [Candidatus Omnitrophica bacterium]|nr:PQQ-dependent sugar dehydrogenase [Candidatus Omnitrophota bacterium]